MIEGEEGDERDVEMYQSAINPTLFVNGEESDPDEMDGEIHACLGRIERSLGRPAQTSPCPILCCVRKNAITCSEVLAVLADDAGSEVLIMEDLPAKTMTAKTMMAKTMTVPAKKDDELKSDPMRLTKRSIPAIEGTKRACRLNPKYFNE